MPYWKYHTERLLKKMYTEFYIDFLNELNNQNDNLIIFTFDTVSQ